MNAGFMKFLFSTVGLSGYTKTAEGGLPMTLNNTIAEKTAVKSINGKSVLSKVPSFSEPAEITSCGDKITYGENVGKYKINLKCSHQNVNVEPLRGNSVVISNGYDTGIDTEDFDMIFSHKRLYNNKLYPEEYVGGNMIDISKISVGTALAALPWISAVGERSITVSEPADYKGYGGCGLSKTLKELCPDLKAGKTYFINAVTQSNVAGIYLNSTDVSNHFWYYGDSRTLDAFDLSSTVSFYGNNTLSGQNVGNCIIGDLRIAEGTEDINWIPYVPNLYPDNPLSILPTGNKTKIKILGKNIVSHDKMLSDGWTDLGNNEFYVATSSSLYRKKIFENTSHAAGQFSISLYIKFVLANDYIGCYPRIVYTDGSDYSFGGIFSDKPTEYKYSAFSSDANKIVDYIDWNYYTGYAQTYVKNFQIEMGPSITNYEPYKIPQTIDFTYTAKDALKQPLIDNALTIGDYASEIYVRDGKTYALIKTRKYEFDGTENWVYSETFNGYYLPVTGLINTKACLSNYGADDEHKAFPTSPYIRPVENVLRLYHFYPYFATVDSLKAAFAVNKIILYVPLREHQEVEIEPITFLETFNGTTILETENFADGNEIKHSAPLFDFTGHDIFYNGVDLYLGEPLRGLEGSADTINRETGKLIRNVGVKIFDGTEDLQTYGYNGYYIIINDMITGNRFVGLCNYLPCVSDPTQTGVIFGADNSILYMTQVYDFLGSTAEAAKAKLAALYSSGAPFTVYYPLAVPTEVNLTRGQMNALAKLKTYADTSVVNCGNKVNPESISFIYQSNIRND